MKKSALSVFIVISLAMAFPAQAQTTVLVAGWDFNGLTSNTLQVINANYADNYNEPPPVENFTPRDGVAAASRGRFLANGTGGSENIPFSPSTGLSISNTPDLIDRPITSREAGPTAVKLFGYLAGPDNALQIAQRATLSPQTFAFQVDATGVENLSLSLWLSKNPVGNLTIDWSYKIGSGEVLSLNQTTDLSSLAASYTHTEISFSSIAALDDQAEVYLIGTARSTAASASGLRFDNVGIYGSLLAVSTSFDVWDANGPGNATVGGDGTWDASASSTLWTNATGTSNGPWSSGSAIFRGTPGTVTVDPAGVTLTGAQFAVSGYTIGGTGALTTTTASTPLRVGDGTSGSAAMTATISAPIAGDGGIEKTDTGTLILSGVNTYTGTTKVTAGTLRLTGTTGAGAVTVSTGGTLSGTGTLGGAVNVENGGTLSGQTGQTLTMPSLTFSDTANLNLSLGAPSTTGLFQVDGALTLDGVLNLTITSGFAAGTYRLINYTGTLTDNTVTFGSTPVSASDLTVQTSVANQVNLVFEASQNFWGGGAGTWSASTTSTAWKNFDGSVTGAWEPQFAIFQATPGVVTVDTTAGAVIFTGAQFAQSGYTIAGQALTTNTASTVVRVGDGTSAGSTMTATISAPITGTGGIQKSDLGTLTLSGANTYGGATTVSAGTLLVNGNQTGAAGATSVASGATLGGTGTIGGDVTILAGGTLTGQSGQVLTMKNLALSNTSNLNVSLGAPSTSGLFQVNGNLTLDGVLNITDSGSFGQGLYRLINYTGSMTNNAVTFGTLPPGTTAARLSLQTNVANQINLLNIDVTSPLPNWIGGSGVWSVDPTLGNNWSNLDGTQTGGWRPGFALFRAPSGTVTVNTTAGPVIFTGLQFAADSYTVTGGAITTNTPNAPVRVGDGTTLGASMVGTISSPIAGTGGIEKTDLGTLLLSGGASTYAGGTRVTAGVLQISADGDLGAATGRLTLNGGTLRAGGAITSAREITMNPAGGTIDTGLFDAQFTGAVDGTGSLQKTGGGVLSFGGTNTFTGATTIAQGGILLSNSSLGTTAISSGARLAGTGTIRGSLTNNGLLSPGASAGTITVTGNYTQSPAAALAIELVSATSFDKLLVTGTATLGGTLAVTTAGTYVPEAAVDFSIIEATGGISGRFATVVSPFVQVSPMLRFDTLYGANKVTLRLSQLPFAEVGNTLNQTSVGAGLDAGILAEGDVDELRTSLNNLSDLTAVGAALGQLSPAPYQRWFNQAVYTAGALVNAAESRLKPEDGESGSELWMEVVRRESRFEAGDDLSKAEGSANGIQLGTDASLVPDLRLGVMFGYTDETLDLDETGDSKTEIERFSAVAYVRYEMIQTFVQAVIGTGYAKLENTRTVNIPGYSQLAEGSTDSRENFGSLRLGHVIPIGRKSATLTPYVGMQYVSWSADEMTEVSADQANLTVREQAGKSLATRLGVSVAWPISGGRVRFTPTFDLAWHHEFEDKPRFMAAQIGGLGGGDFEIRTLAPGSEGLVASIGFDAAFGERITAYGRLAIEKSTAVETSVEARGGVNYRF